MKKILVINTGGTFSSTPGDHGLSPGETKDEIQEMLAALSPDLEIKLEDYCALDSSNIAPDDWRRISRRIAEIIGEYDGVVIIHGTDTMSYTASMLAFMLQYIPIPVVLTGSQLPIGVPMSDAEDNCRCAISMAASGRGGVYIAFDRKIMLGCRTSKVRTMSFNAFESINYPNVAEFNAFGMRFSSSIEKEIETKEFHVHTEYSDKIAVLKLFPGMHSDIFSFLKEHGYEGVYIEGFGLGGVPFLKSNLTIEIEKASKEGMPILVGSQCRYEGSNLSVYETGQRVLACGGIPVHDMTQEAVVTKLMWCLGRTKNREKIQELFQTSLVREVTIP